MLQLWLTNGKTSTDKPYILDTFILDNLKKKTKQNTPSSQSLYHKDNNNNILKKSHDIKITLGHVRAELNININKDCI
jgi:hypothetical protein